jgi:hypothetical protein
LIGGSFSVVDPDLNPGKSNWPQKREKGRSFIFKKVPDVLPEEPKLGIFKEN